MERLPSITRQGRYPKGISRDTVANYLLGQNLAYVTTYKYVENEGDEQKEVRQYSNLVAVFPFLEA